MSKDNAKNNFNNPSKNYNRIFNQKKEKKESNKINIYKQMGLMV
jgi:hypothetical protein